MPTNKFLVTVTYSTRWALLRLALASAQKEGIDRAVVVDNGAAVDIAALARVEFGDFVDVVTLDRNTGSAGGFKAGIQRALDLGAIYLLLLDDDNEMQSGSLAALTDAYRKCSAHTPEDKLAILAYRSDRQTDAATNLSTSGMRGNHDAFFGFHILDVPFKLYRRTHWGMRWIAKRPILPLVVVDVAPYSGMYFHRAVPELLGLPDERFLLYADDTDFSYRLTRAGGSIVLATDACLNDLELSWNVKKRFSNTFDALLWGDGDFRAFYSTRNNAYFEHCATGPNRRVRSFNRTVYMLLLQARALMAGRMSRFRLLQRAVQDGEAGHLGEHADFPLQQSAGLAVAVPDVRV
jgi:GT2 family glycosyltransferase